MARSGMRARIIRSLGADTLGQALNFAIRVFLVPLFLIAWGPKAYGEWLILTAIAAWFSLGDLGGQLYFVNRLTSDWAASNLKAFQSTLSTGVLFFAVAASALFGITLVILNSAHVDGWLAARPAGLEVTKGVILIMAFRVLASLPIGLFLGIFRAVGAQATSVMYGNVMLVIHFLASVIALRAGAGMLVLAALEVFPYLLIFAVATWDLRRRLPPEIRLFALGNAKRDIFKASISPSLHFLGVQFALALFIQGSVLVVARTLGPIEVAIFSSLRTITNVVARFMGMFAHASWPEITRLTTLNKREEVARLFKAVLLLTLLFGIIYLGVIALLGRALFTRWLNDALPYDERAMYLLGCQVILTAIWTSGGNVLMATNRHEFYARWQIGSNMLALTLCHVCATKYGLSGSVLGLILGQTAVMPVVVVSLLRQYGHPHVSSDVARFTVFAGIAMILCFLVYY